MFHRSWWKLFLAAVVVGLWLWLRFRTVPEEPGDHLKAGLEALAARQFSAAESHFRAELRLVPAEPQSTEHLAALLIRTGRAWEAAPLIRLTFKQHRVRQDYLVCFSGDPDQVIDETMLNDWSRQAPEDHAPLVGLAKTAMRNGKPEEAEKLIEKALAASPADVEAHVVRGQLELTRGISGLAAWNSKLPRDAERHSETWFIRAEWCEQAGDSKMATRCCLEGLRLNPNDPRGCVRAAKLLGDETGKTFRERAEMLTTTLNAVAFVQANGNSPAMWSIVESFYALGRFQEAAQWGQIAMTSDTRLMMQMTSDRAFADKYQQIQLAAQSGKVSNPASAIDLKSWPPWSPPVSN